jgi:hypothetical protein
MKALTSIQKYCFHTESEGIGLAFEMEKIFFREKANERVSRIRSMVQPTLKEFISRANNDLPIF